MKDAEILFAAIGEIQDDFLVEAEARSGVRSNRTVRNLMAACLALCLIALPVSAEIANGYVSNLLAPLYGRAQTEIVDSIGVPVGASVTVGDYTLTADAVIGDRYNIAVVYSLTRTDGGVLPEGLQFDDWERIGRGGSGGGWLGFELSEDRTKLNVIEQWTSSGRLFGLRRNKEVVYRDLIIRDRENETETLVQEGQWALKFTVRYEDTTEKIPVKDLSVTGESGEKYTVHKIFLSPVGIHMEITGPRVSTAERMAEVSQNFTVSMVFRDGTCVPVEDYNLAFHSKGDNTTAKGQYGAMFDAPIALEEIRALVVCGTEIPVDIV